MYTNLKMNEYLINVYNYYIIIIMVVVHNRRQKYMTNSLFDIAAHAFGVETYIY